jgi:hypothetical protein
MLKNLKFEILREQNSSVNSRRVSSDSILDISTGNCRRALVNEPGIMRNHTERHKRPEIVAAQVSPFAPTPVVKTVMK